MRCWAGTEDTGSYLSIHGDEAFITTTLDIKQLAVGTEVEDDVELSGIGPTFEWVDVRPFRTEHALIAGGLEAKPHRNDNVNRDGIDALAADLLIAAVALDTGAAVVTRNTGDFERFEDLDVESC